MRKRTLFLSVAGATLLLLLLAGAAFTLGRTSGVAAQAAPGTPRTSGTPGAGKQGQACGDFASKLAGNLGVSEDKLRDAFKQTALQEVDAAQAAGRITADQAQRLKDRINQGGGNLPCFHLGGDKVGQAARGVQRGQMAMILPQMVDATAGYLGTDRATLMQELRDQGSLQAVAAKHGKDTPDGKAGLEQAMEAALRKTLADSGADQARVDQVANQFKQNFDRLYTRNLKRMGPGAGADSPFGDLFDGELPLPAGPAGGFRGPLGGPFGGHGRGPAPSPATGASQ